MPDAASWPGPDLAGPPSAILDARQRLGLGALLRLGEPMPAEPGPPADLGSIRRRNWAVVVPLLAVLVVQAILSFRLIWTCTAFQDEGLYLWAGHLEISHWLHGTPLPPFATYFSGAPVIYPPIGAVADSLGGLAAARGLSLVFMLGTTALLWRTTARIFGYRAAFFAAGLFALMGLTLHVGAFATFDALAMFLLAVSVWCAVTASGRDDDATGWVVASAVALALANATAYSAAIFDPVVILLAI
ncbi:MAG: glycosyltransferase family 39 protein, partial [Streptosporangiaceae bacterium]